MCGRYELHTHPAAMALAFGLPIPPEITPRYNVAPSQTLPVVRLNKEGNRELAAMRWGLMPHWAKDKSIAYKTIQRSRIDRCHRAKRKLTALGVAPIRYG